MNVIGNEFFRSEDHTAETAALTVNMLGRGIDDAVRPELQEVSGSEGRTASSIPRPSILTVRAAVSAVW